MLVLTQEQSKFFPSGLAGASPVLKHSEDLGIQRALAKHQVQNAPQFVINVGGEPWSSAPLKHRNQPNHGLNPHSDIYDMATRVFV